MNLARRDMIKLAGTGALVASASPAFSMGGPAADGIDYASDAGYLKTVVLMRGALDERLSINFIRARYFGVIADEMKPLFGVVAATFNRYRQVAGGGYEFATREIAYFTDHDCTHALDTYENPYTGETVSIPEGGVGAALVRIGPDMHYALKEERPEVDMKHTFYPIHLDGDDVWLTEAENVAVGAPGAPPSFRYQDVATYHAPRAVVEAPDATAVSALVGYSGLTSWRPWLNMPAGTQGHLSSFGSGRTNVALDDLPRAWLEASAVRNPHVLDNPGALLDEVWNG